MRIRTSANQCGKLQLQYRRLARKIDAELAKPRPRRDRPLLDQLFREYNAAVSDAFEYDCGWARDPALRGVPGLGRWRRWRARR